MEQMCHLLYKYYFYLPFFPNFLKYIDKGVFSLYSNINKNKKQNEGIKNERRIFREGFGFDGRDT